MKYPALIIALLIPQMAQARIGESIEECDKRYGGAIEGSTELARGYIKNGMAIIALFYKDTCLNLDIYLKPTKPDDPRPTIGGIANGTEEDLATVHAILEQWGGNWQGGATETSGVHTANLWWRYPDKTKVKSEKIRWSEDRVQYLWRRAHLWAWRCTDRVVGIKRWRGAAKEARDRCEGLLWQELSERHHQKEREQHERDRLDPEKLARERAERERKEAEKKKKVGGF